MNTPTENDWRFIDSEDLDAAYAKRQFLGKSYDEALLMFERNALHYGEDLVSMPRVPLNFYAPAFAEYITSDNASEDADGASSFLSRVFWILKETPGLLSEQTRDLLIHAANRVAKHQEFYDADVEIYGRFEDLGREIQQLQNSSKRRDGK